MNCKSFLVVVLALAQLSTAVAADNEKTPSMLGEATKAVMDRVFGVKGEAENIEYNVIELSKVSPMNSAARSFLVPGWGQHFNRQPVKGSVLFLTFAAATYGSVYLHQKSKNTYNDYKDRGLKDDSLFNDYEDQRTQSLILGVSAGLLWAFSVFDAYRNAYNPLYTKTSHVELAYGPDGSTVRWSRKF